MAQTSSINKIKIAILSQGLVCTSMADCIERLEDAIKEMIGQRGAENIDLMCFPQTTIDARVSIDELLGHVKRLVAKHKSNCAFSFKQHREKSVIYSQLLVAKDGKIFMRRRNDVSTLTLRTCSIEIGLLLGHEIYNPLKAHSSALQHVKIEIVGIDDEEIQDFEDLMLLGSTFAQQARAFVILTSQRKQLCRVFSPLGSILEKSISGGSGLFELDMVDILLQTHLWGTGALCL